MGLDLTARRNLELTETMRNKEKKGSLLWVLDHTHTSMGKRLLRSYIEQPLVKPALIIDRLDAVEQLCHKSVVCAEISELLERVYDLERLMTKIVYNTANGIFQAVGDAKHPLYYLILSSMVNVVLDLLFVAGFGMGVDGAALATVISQATSAILGLRRLMHTTGCFRIFPKKVRFHADLLKQLLIMGIPSGIQNSIISIANVVVQSSINVFGATAMAGCGAYSKIGDFAFLPITSFSLALSTFVGQNLGAKKYDRARQGARFGILTCITLAEIIGILIFAFAPDFVGLFNRDPQVVAYGTLQARTITLFYFLLSFSHAVSGVMRGAGRAVVPMLVMLGTWCFFRIAYITFVARASGNIQLVFWAYPITWAMSSIAFFLYYIKADWPHYLDKKAAQTV